MPTESDLSPYLPRARAIARRTLGCDHLAADALQEALIALWRRSTAPAEPGPWLVRAADLRARQLRRALSRRDRHEARSAARCIEHPECDNPLHHAAAHELSARLVTVFERLPHAQREVLEHQLETAADYRETAAALALPVGTVRSRLSRARAVVRGAIGAYGA